MSFCLLLFSLQNIELDAPTRDAAIEEISTFAKNDPYVTNKLVTDWYIQDYTVVVGHALDGGVTK